MREVINRKALNDPASKKKKKKKNKKDEDKPQRELLPGIHP